MPAEYHVPDEIYTHVPPNMTHDILVKTWLLFLAFSVPPTPIIINLAKNKHINTFKSVVKYFKDYYYYYYE